MNGDQNMARNRWYDLGPSLLLGVGIVGSALVAALAAKYRWGSEGWVLIGPLFLGLAVVGADALKARLSGQSFRPSHAALLVGGAFLLAGSIVTLRDPGLFKTLIPLLGAASWVALLVPPDPQRRPCGARPHPQKGV